MMLRALVLLLTAVVPAGAEVIGIAKCKGAVACEIVEVPPNPVTPDPNDGRLIVWNERQHVRLAEDLAVDRVADPRSPFVERRDGGWVIRAGTWVSSHYLQWDPGPGSDSFVSAVIELDQPIFAFITGDARLFASDHLGLPELDYNDFWLRGLEDEDWTTMRDTEVAISWWAGSPGDWTRLITAGVPVARTPVVGARAR